MEGMLSLEPLKQSVLNNTLSAAQPEEGITEALADRDHSALGVSLDSGLMAGMSRLEPFQQSVLSKLLVTRPVEVLTETDTQECSALASPVEYGHSNLELSAWLMLNTNQAGDAELDTDPSEHSAPMTNDGHVEDLPSSGPLEHSVLEAKWRNDNLDSSNEPQFGSDLGQSSLEDAIHREVLRSRPMGRVSAHDVNGLLLSPENVFFGDQEMPLDEVRSEGLRQWNMDMDVEYQHETFNVCRCITVEMCMMQRTRRSMILSKWRARRMWRTIILMFLREWD